MVNKNSTGTVKGAMYLWCELWPTISLRQLFSLIALFAMTALGATPAQALTAQGAVTITSAASGTYGNAYMATASGGNGTGAIVWALGTGSTASGAAINASTGAVTATSIGLVRIKAYRAGDSTYAQSATTADFTITLSSRPITVTLTGSKNYDGTTTPTGASASITSGSLVGSDTISYAFSNLPSASAGTYPAGGGAGIAFRSSSHAESSNGTVVFTKPTGTAVNDVLVACLSYDVSGGTATPPTGWTSLGVANNGYDGQTSEVFLHVVDGSEGATFAFGYPYNPAAGVMLCYAGVNPTAPLNVPAVQATNDSAIGSGGTVSSPNVTPTVSGTMLVWFGGLDPDGDVGNATYTAPTGFTLRETSNNLWSSEAAADSIKAAAGATGVLAGSVAFSGPAATFGFTVALAPAGGAGLVTATVSNPSNYLITYAGAYTINSQSAQSAVSITSVSTGTYGTAYTATASGGNGTGAIVWALGTGSTASGAAINASTGAVSATSSGTVKIKAYRAGDSTYAQSATTADFTITFAARPITVTLAGSKTYDGATTPTGASASITAGSLVASDTISYAFGNTSSANSGSYSGMTTATVANASAPTTRTGSYAITYGGTYTINSAALSPQGAVTITSASTGTYGNAYTATASGGNGTGAIVWALGTASTASGAAINASTGAVTATSVGTVKIKAYRAGDSTYAQSATTADFTITLAPRPITVTLAGSKNYDGTTSSTGASASITSGSLVGADTISYAFSNTPSASVGSYSAQAGGGVAFRSSSSGGNYTGTVVLSKPAGTAVNDVLLACLSYDAGSGTTTPPSGWTSLGVAFNYYDGQTSEVFLRVVDGTEGTTFNFGNSSGTAAGLMLCYSGVNPGAPLNVPAAHVTNDSAISSGGAVTAPSVTTTTNGSMLVWLAGLDGDGNSGAATFTAPSGYTLRQTSNYSWNYESSADRLQTTGGATGVITGSAAFPGGAGTFGFTVALAPAGGTSLVTATISNPSSYTLTYAGAYTINNATAPVISSLTTANAQVGAAFSYQITASNTPTSFGATGLPAGLSVNTTTGLISGTPTPAGTSSVTLSATNAGGTGSATLNLTVNNSGAAVVAINAGGSAVGSFAADNYFNAGTVVVYPGTAVIDTSAVSNPPPAAVYQSVRWGDLTYTLPGLTPGTSYKVRLHFAELYFTAANQRQFNVAINGSSVLTNFDIVATAGGINRAVVQEFNATANASGQILVQFSTGAYNYADISAIEVIPTSATAPVITSSATASGQIGSAFSYQITASNTPTSFNATGLPAGLSVNTTTGLISGTPTAAGTSSVTLNATNASGSGSAILNLIVASAANTPPTITTVANQTTTAGVAVGPLSFVVGDAQTAATSLTVSGSSSNTALVPTANLAFGGSGANRTVTVTPVAGLAGTATVTLSVNDGALTTSSTFTLTVNATAPGISSPGTAIGQTGVAFSYQIIASGNPTSYSATGLPPGLSINTSTGLISGTPTTLGSTNVTISATNSGGTVSSTIALTILATLPYTTDFESGQSYTLASLQGQQGWTVSSGAASVTNSDHSNGTQSVLLTASNPTTSISESFGSSPSNAIEYFDFFAKPVAQASLGSAATFTVEGAKFALQVSGSQGLLRVYSGNGSGGGTWTSTAFSTTLTTGNVTAAWVRFTVRLDFTHQTWDLYANSAMVAADIPFTTTGSTYLSIFRMLGDVATASHLDYIYAGPTNPVFADTNNNGIDDNWETAHGFSLGANNRNTSPTGNGVTVIQAYVNGTNPNDYFNGAAPTLTIVSGNNQTAPAGQFNAQPFDIGVWNAAGTAPLVNAPVTFTLQGTDLLLARTNTSNPQLYNSVTLYSDADGTVQAYFKQPVLVGVQSQINVTAGSRQLTLQTISAAIGGADTDGNGLADSWERQYFGHIGVDPNADPDGDGLSNLAEFQLGTNPLNAAVSTTPSNLATTTALKVHRPN